MVQMLYTYTYVYVYVYMCVCVWQFNQQKQNTHSLQNILHDTKNRTQNRSQYILKRCKPQWYETRMQQEESWKICKYVELNTLLNKQMVKKKSKDNYLKTTCQNLWDAAKAPLRGKFIAINNLTLHLKTLGKKTN